MITLELIYPAIHAVEIEFQRGWLAFSILWALITTSNKKLLKSNPVRCTKSKLERDPELDRREEDIKQTTHLQYKQHIVVARSQKNVLYFI